MWSAHQAVAATPNQYRIPEEPPVASRSDANHASRLDILVR
jgi:hypothetical protein